MLNRYATAGTTNPIATSAATITGTLSGTTDWATITTTLRAAP